MTSTGHPGPPAQDAPSEARLRKVRHGVSFVALVLVLGLLEAGVRMLAPQDLRVNCRQLNARNYFVNRRSTTARHEQGGYRVRYRFNEFGLRGGPVGPEPVRVLFLGDSFTFGYLLDEPRTYVGLFRSYAERDLPRGEYQLLNGGTEGWGAADYVAFMEDYGCLIRPSVVTVFLNYDDIRRATGSGLYALKDEGTLALEARARELDGRLRLKRFLDRTRVYDWLLERSNLVRLLRNRAARMRAFQDRQILQAPARGEAATSSRTWAKEVALGRALFRRLHALCARQGATLLVITTGYQAKAFANAAASADQVFYEQAPEMFEAEGIPYHDLSGAVAADTHGRWRDFVLKGDPHPNEAGAELIARHAWKWLGPRLKGTSAHAPGS